MESSEEARLASKRIEVEVSRAVNQSASEVVRRAYSATLQSESEGGTEGQEGSVTSSTQYDPVHYAQWYCQQQFGQDEEEEEEEDESEGCNEVEERKEMQAPVRSSDPSFSQLPPNYDLFTHLTPMKPHSITRTPSTSEASSSPHLGFTSRTPLRVPLTTQQQREQQEKQQKQQRAGFVEQLLHTALNPPTDSFSVASSSTKSTSDIQEVPTHSPVQLVQAYQSGPSPIKASTPEGTPKKFNERSPGTDIKARPFVPMHQRSDSEKEDYGVTGEVQPTISGEETKEVSLGSSFPEPTPGPTEPSTTGSDHTNSSHAPTLAAALGSMVGSFHASVRRLPEEAILPFSHDLELFVDTFLVLNQQQKEARDNLIQLVEQLVRQVLTPEEGGEIKVKVHGSYPSGLSLVSSDVDFVVTGYADAPRFALDRVAAAFAQYDSVKGSPVQQGSGASPNPTLGESQTVQGECYDVTAVPYTRVPVVKLVDRHTFLRADISFGGGDNEGSMAFTNSLLELHQPHSRRLILLLKYLVKECRFGETERGGVTSFVLALLISHFFQERERMQKEEDQQLEQQIQQQHVAETVASFLPVVASEESLTVVEMLPLTAQQAEEVYTPDVYDVEKSPEATASLPLPPSTLPPPPQAVAPPTPPIAPTSASESKESSASPPAPLPFTDNLGRLLLEFCSYWGSYFDYIEWGVHFDTETFVSNIVRKPESCRQRGQHLHIMSPFGAGYDVTARMHLTREVQVALYHCLTVLSKEMNLSSLLSVVAAHGGWVPNSQFLVMHHQHQLITQQWEYHQQQMYAAATYRGGGGSVAAGPNAVRGTAAARGRGAARGRSSVRAVGKPPSFQDGTSSEPVTPTFGSTPTDGRGGATPPLEALGAYESVGTMTAPMVFPPPPFRVNQTPNYVQPPVSYNGQVKQQQQQQQQQHTVPPHPAAGYATLQQTQQQPNTPAGLTRASMGQQIPHMGYVPAAGGGPPSPSMVAAQGAPVPVSGIHTTLPPHHQFPSSYPGAIMGQHQGVGQYSLPTGGVQVQGQVHTHQAIAGNGPYYRGGERPGGVPPTALHPQQQHQQHMNPTPGFPNEYHSQHSQGFGNAMMNIPQALGTAVAPGPPLAVQPPCSVGGGIIDIPLTPLGSTKATPVGGQTKKDKTEGAVAGSKRDNSSTTNSTKKAKKSGDADKRKTPNAEPVSLPSMGDAPALPTTTPNNAPQTTANNKWIRSGEKDNTVSAASLVRGTPKQEGAEDSPNPGPSFEESEEGQKEDVSSSPAEVVVQPAPVVKQLFQARSGTTVSSSPPPSTLSGSSNTNARRKTAGGAMFQSAVSESGSLFSRLSEVDRGSEVREPKETREEKSPWGGDRLRVSKESDGRDGQEGGTKSKKSAASENDTRDESNRNKRNASSRNGGDKERDRSRREGGRDGGRDKDSGRDGRKKSRRGRDNGGD